jgi:hypothetical protein
MSPPAFKKARLPVCLRLSSTPKTLSAEFYLARQGPSSSERLMARVILRRFMIFPELHEITGCFDETARQYAASWLGACFAGLSWDEGQDRH